MAEQCEGLGRGAREGRLGNRSYCLITPCRNEADYIRSTLETTTGQTEPPARWVIVDDGSTDNTPAILEEYAARFPYIHVLRKEDRGHRAVGPGVIEAFYRGLETVDLDDYTYVCKYDGDLEVPLDYFARSMDRMEAEPLLGNFSGKLYQRDPDGSLHIERTGDENAVGPIKFYRRACFQDIGGFVPEVSWDGIDGHICRMNGWIAQSEDDPALRIIHLRAQGSSQGNIWVGRVRWGRGKYFMGSSCTTSPRRPPTASSNAPGSSGAWASRSATCAPRSGAIPATRTTTTADSCVATSASP